MVFDSIALWGKARPFSNDSCDRHPLLAHMLDVAAVAMRLPGIDRLRLDRKQIAFLAALHDIGKVAEAFQAQAVQFWPEKIFGPLDLDKAALKIRHDAVGLYVLTQARLPKQQLDAFFSSHEGEEWSESEKNIVLRSIAGHHGHPVSAKNVSRHSLGKKSEELARELIDIVHNVIQPPPLLRFREEEHLNTLSWRLAGAVTLADWIGSCQEWFPYASIEGDLADIRRYWEEAQKLAAKALDKAGLGDIRVAPFKGIPTLFSDEITFPSLVQSWAESVELPSDPMMTIIEDRTGSGKTEAALILAHRLMASGHGEGVFFALPTMATANAMFERLGKVYGRFFAEGSKPSLALAHGKAKFDDRFAAAISVEETSAEGDDALPAELNCAAWLASSNRRALLAQMGVGTIDQALMAVLPVKYTTLRQQGLAGKILIVDECHAFDPYMKAELTTLIRFHSEMGGSIILLSATLTHKLRNNFVKAFLTGRGIQKADIRNSTIEKKDYPLVTFVSESMPPKEVSFNDDSKNKSSPLAKQVVRLSGEEAGIEHMQRAAQQGVAGVWIRNTVDDVIKSAVELRKRGIDALVFHARFAMVDRLKREQEVIQSFGKKSMKEERRRILIASQVIEQSLDVDFDVMCSDLAPADLMIQRAGRLWRHRREENRPVEDPKFLVISPEPVDVPHEGWIKDMLPGTSAVYQNDALLWRTARALFCRQNNDVLGEVRSLIEYVADDRAIEAIPEALTKNAMEAQGKERSQNQFGYQNVLDFDAGYSDTQWCSEERISTRLDIEPSVCLRLALVKGEEIVPYAQERMGKDDLLKAWALSEVSVPLRKIARCPAPEGMEKAAKAARAQWGRWEREAEDIFLLAVMRREGDDWIVTGETKEGKPVTLTYSVHYGLQS